MSTRYTQTTSGTVLQVTDTQYPNGTGGVSQVVASWNTGVAPTADQLAAVQGYVMALNGG